MQNVDVFWFRRDLRLHDNHAFYKSLLDANPVLPVFIFDWNILHKLPAEDQRVVFIYRQLEHLRKSLRQKGKDLKVLYGKPEKCWQELISNYAIDKVFANEDYEPYAKERDPAIEKMLMDNGASMHFFKDHVVLRYDEVLKDDGNPYTVFTPYSRKWRRVLESQEVASFPSEEKLDQCLEVITPFNWPALAEMGFVNEKASFPESDVSNELLKHYGERRDFPAVNGTSRMGVHLRFGTVSIRQLLKKALPLSDTYVNELIWRDFYAMILAHFPHVVNGAFRAKYNRVEWLNDDAAFARWCEGKTGIPIVDAGMRELNATGYMHNRVRMIVASFLVKNLLIDWRWGEQYFAEKLLDFELASNNGGWQWAAGSGCDAAPYFRVFNPISQAKKFDPNGQYIKKWVPEINTERYPEAMVDLKETRVRALKAYEVVKG